MPAHIPFQPKLGWELCLFVCFVLGKMPFTHLVDLHRFLLGLGFIFTFLKEEHINWEVVQKYMNLFHMYLYMQTLYLCKHFLQMLLRGKKTFYQMSYLWHLASICYLWRRKLNFTKKQCGMCSGHHISPLMPMAGRGLFQTPSLTLPLWSWNNSSDWETWDEWLDQTPFPLICLELPSQLREGTHLKFMWLLPTSKDTFPTGLQTDFGFNDDISRYLLGRKFSQA